ncbi:MAG: efflux RND transporter periplasmic adaptor subunit [Flavobacteriaceae bacterium]
MKKIIPLLILSFILSCGDAPKKSATLTALTSEKSDLMQQIDSLNNVLKSVEERISKLDTTKRLNVVTAIKAEEKLFRHYIKVQGTVEADQSVELYPERSGTITRIFVKEGQKVTKGQTLLQIDDSIIERSLMELQTQLDLAATTFERQERLWNQNIGSELQFLQAKAQKEGLENSINSLKEQGKKLKVLAPFSGIIDEVFAKTGGLAAPQIPTFRLVNLNTVHIESEVTESYLKSIKKGTAVDLFFPSIGKNIQAKIDQVGNFINPNNRSFKIRINIENPNNELKANLLADVKINDFKETGIVIPTKLIQRDRVGKTFVYTLIKDGEGFKVQKTYIQDKMTYDNESFIVDGLTPYTLIVGKGSRLVKANENVILGE